MKSLSKRLIEIVMYASFIVFLVFTYKTFNAYNASKKYNRKIIGEASIVQYVPSADGKNEFWDIYVNYTVDGSKYTALTSEPKYESPRIGDTYTIWYNSDNPERYYVGINPPSEFKQFLMNSSVGLLCGIVALYINSKIH